MVTFKLEVFEGPLDLLLHLIAKNKVSIYDIPISLITDQYLITIQNMEKMDIEIASEFVVMAAQLIYIKSKMLLPADEDEEVSEFREELVDRLVEYQKYKQAAGHFGLTQHAGAKLYFKEPDKLPIPKLPPITPMEISVLLEAFESVLERQERRVAPKREEFEVLIRPDTVSVRSRIAYILGVFKNKKKVDFMQLFRDIHNRAEAVATFLAILELIGTGRMKTEKIGNSIMCNLDGDENDDEYL